LPETLNSAELVAGHDSLDNRTTMKILVDKIGPEGLDYDEPIAVDWITEVLGADAVFSAVEPGQLKAHFEKVGDAVSARGEAKLTLRALCSRCVEPITLVIDDEFSISLFERGEEPPARTDGELQLDDLGVATYENGEIDINEFIRDEILLQLPMNPRCSETCAGLCPQCGGNLNNGPCGCSAIVDPRWAALQKFQKKLD
jgi:uncharacterized protein